MAKTNKNSLSGIRASGGGNSGTAQSPRVPPMAHAAPQLRPPDLKTTYGAGDGAGGAPVPANDGGNRKTPISANKLPMPQNHDSYNPPSK